MVSILLSRASLVAALHPLTWAPGPSYPWLCACLWGGGADWGGELTWCASRGTGRFAVSLTLGRCKVEGFRHTGCRGLAPRVDRGRLGLRMVASCFYADVALRSCLQTGTAGEGRYLKMSKGP